MSKAARTVEAVAKRLAITNRGAASRLALVDILRRAGETVTLVEVHAWPRHMQGTAYLWAISKLQGIENVPPPWSSQ
jgi:hypothetical protein